VPLPAAVLGVAWALVAPLEAFGGDSLSSLLLCLDEPSPLLLPPSADVALKIKIAGNMKSFKSFFKPVTIKCIASPHIIVENELVLQEEFCWMKDGGLLECFMLASQQNGKLCSYLLSACFIKSVDLICHLWQDCYF
jgi:hypothetical protein